MYMRYLTEYIREDLKNDPMIFIAGPRQVGKTTLALSFLENIDQYDAPQDHPAYLNWDIRDKRKIILSGSLPKEKIIIFDEIHKYKDWRNYLKGIYDQYKSKCRIIVTGSAKLDFYGRGGDSLQGRYVFYRLHPLTLNDPQALNMNQLLKLGGFPEPFYKGDEVYWARWQNLRSKRLIEEDLIYLEQVRDLSKIEILMDVFPDRVASLLSINSLREDLSASQQSIQTWIKILENLYFCYPVTPYTGSELKSIKKECKYYLWDWSLVEDKGRRVENFLASCLLKYCHIREDRYGEKLKLHFFRTKDKRGIDFLVTKKNKPLFAVECKSGSKNLSSHLKSLRSHFKDIPFFQTYLGDEHLVDSKFNVEIIPLEKFIREILKL